MAFLPLFAFFSNKVFISPPSIISTSATSDSLTVNSSAFSTIPSGRDSHYSSQWLLATDNGFSNVIRDSGEVTSYKTSYTFTGLNASTTYYSKVRHKGVNVDWSTYSTSSSYSTSAPPIGVGSVVGGDIAIGQIGGQWLLIAPPDKRAYTKWGLYGIDTSLPNVGATNYPNINDTNTGNYNTTILCSGTYRNVVDSGGNTGSPAALWCREQAGGTYDFPSIDELEIIWANRNNSTVVAAESAAGGFCTLAYLWNAWLSSSTESSYYTGGGPSVWGLEMSAGSKSEIMSELLLA